MEKRTFMDGGYEYWYNVFLLYIFFFPPNVPNPNYAKSTIDFINKNFNRYVKVVAILERNDIKTDYTDYKLSKINEDLTEEGFVGVYKENDTRYYEFAIRSRFTYLEMLIYSSNDHPPYQNTEHFEVKRLKPKWFFVIEN